MTGIQALERPAPSKPLRPGQVEKREFEYIRHGTQALIANLDVATGRIVSPSVAARRTEADLVADMTQTFATDSEAKWIIVLDQLNTHQSEALVRLVAHLCQLPDDLGIKDKSGILPSMTSRAAFLRPFQRKACSKQVE